MHEKWFSAGNVLLILTAVLAVACVAAQALLARWWETSGGRHVMAFQGVLAAVLTLWALRVWLPDLGWLVVARGLAFGGLPVVFTWRLLIILRTWWDKHRTHAEVTHGDDR